MEKNKKELKILSILILVLVAWSVIKAIVNVCLYGMPKLEATEGVSQEVMQVAGVIVFVLSFVVLLPQVYVGVKGILVADKGAKGKGHIIWAIILAVLAAIAAISSAISVFKAFSADNLVSLGLAATDLAVYLAYFVIARKIAND